MQSTLPQRAADRVFTTCAATSCAGAIPCIGEDPTGAATCAWDRCAAVPSSCGCTEQELRAILRKVQSVSLHRFFLSWRDLASWPCRSDTTLLGRGENMTKSIRPKEVNRKSSLSTVVNLFTAVLAGAWALTAAAQTAPSAEATSAPVVEEVVVTGSRIAAPNEVSTSPIQVVTSQEI